MKLKLDKTLSLVAIGVVSALQGVQAAPVYEIKNIEDFDLNGTIESTRNGYGMFVNGNNESVGVSKGKKKLSVSDDDDDGVIDIEDGIAPEEQIIYSIDLPIVANNFTFTSDENGASGAWIPTFESVFGTTPPKDSDPDVPETINSIDAYYYGISTAGVKVGAYTAPEQTVEYTGSNEDQEYWYYREFEERGFVKLADGTEVPLLPPITEYYSEDEDVTVTVGGMSIAAAINENNVVAGYASTELSSTSIDRIESCITGETYPIDICVQREQYPNSSGYRNIVYQTRAYVWDVDNAQGIELPLGLESESETVFTAQGLGINVDGIVAGRSHVYRNGNTDKLAYDAAYWKKDSDGDYQYHWIPMKDDQRYSIAYDINDNGILVGSYNQYLDGYPRDKFFYFDTNNPDEGFVTPHDFFETISDRASRPKDINNLNQVVGYIEVTADKEKPRVKAGFLFDKDKDEFSDLNTLLTCGSKGYEQDAEGEWVRNRVEVEDGSGDTLSYESEIRIVEANSIGEDGTIVGTAFIRKPSYQFDSSGNLIIGDNGLPLFEIDGNGDPVTAFIPRMVVLQPTSNGEACPVEENDNSGNGNYERKGAASLGALLLLPLLWLRRRVKR
ncbi:DUF3466 family protein [Shewanella waksmanii]|uniref:DUF3466 family protein n=1 Tax=Shewanella waksmanii TaxID=213783 RepID=UPI0004900133|nr:DUF3466 family protein [Shewanella waksmanii]